jgi:hypothetical protein
MPRASARFPKWETVHPLLRQVMGSASGVRRSAAGSLVPGGSALCWSGLARASPSQTAALAAYLNPALYLTRPASALLGVPSCRTTDRCALLTGWPRVVAVPRMVLLVDQSGDALGVWRGSMGSRPWTGRYVAGLARVRSRRAGCGSSGPTDGSDSGYGDFGQPQDGAEL